jgi:hypothetical protein
MISDAQRTVGLNLLGSPKDLGQRALSKSSLGLLRCPGLLPLVKDINWHEAAASLEGLAEGRLALDPLGLGVDVREADFDVLGPKRHEPPAHDIQATLAGSGIIADHRERVGRRHIPTGRDVWGRPIRRDREDEPDLADIGGETGAAIHSASIAGPGHRPKLISASPAPAVRLTARSRSRRNRRSRPELPQDRPQRLHPRG